MKRILVYGDIILDKYTSYVYKKKCPDRPDVDAYVRSDEHVYPGGAANVALNLAELCGPDAVVQLIGAASSSTLRMIKQRSKSRIDLAHCFELENEIVKQRLTLGDKMVARLDSYSRYESNLKFILQDRLAKAIAFQNHDAIVLSDYNYGLVDGFVKEACRPPVQSNSRLFIDTKERDIRKFNEPFVLKLNFQEYSDIGMIEDRPPELFVKNCVVTRGENGASLMRGNASGKNRYITTRQEFPQPVMDRPTDVSGCGDTFLAAMAFWTTCVVHDDVEGAIAFANVCAGSVIHEEGTSCVSYDAVKSAIPEDRRNR